MEEIGNGTPTLFTLDDTTNEYVEYQPPEPPAFKETLPEDLRDNEHLNDVKDGADLARYYVDLKANYLRPPDTADGYEFEIPEGFEIDESDYNRFREVAFENGINQKQFQQILAMEVERVKAGAEAYEKAVADTQAKAEAELKTEWGADYEKKVESAKQFLNHEKIASAEFKQFLEETRFGDSPHVIRLFAKLSDLISEDGFQQPGKGDRAAGPSVGEDGRPMLSFPSMED